MDQCDDSMIPSGFPNELRVLAVDDDAFSLKMLERLLLQCGYKVTVAQHAHEALKLLRENKDVHDLVISDVNMPDMDGFKLLEIVGLEMDLPVIMLSVDCDVKSVMKGIMHGAVDYLVKPVRLEELKVIWKHVARKSLKEMKDLNDLRNKFDPASQAHDVRDSPLIQNFKNHRKERDFTDSADSDDDSASQKKPRVTWTAELHTEFINAVNQLGLDRAVPKRILDIMNIPGLSRENVASHLQKYRRGLKRNGVGLSEHFNADAGTSGYAGSSNFVTLNNQCPAVSLENFGANRCRTIPAPSSSFLAHQSHGGHATMPPAWLTHPFTHHSDLGQQYTISLQSRQFVTGWQHSINPQTSRLVMENPDIITNSLVMNASNQASHDMSNRPFFPRSNQQNSYAHTSQNAIPRDRNSSLSSTSQLGYAIERQNTGTILNDTHLERCSLDCLSTELNTMLPSEQGQQQYSACSGVDAEIEVLVNCDLVDVNSNIIEDLYQSSPFDLIIVPAGNASLEINASLNDCAYEDELHAALKQFRS